MTTTYEAAFQKLLHRPIDLNPEDIRAIRLRDPWLAKAAVASWEAAWRWKDYRRKYPAPVRKRALPVVKLNRPRR